MNNIKTIFIMSIILIITILLSYIIDLNSQKKNLNLQLQQMESDNELLKINIEEQNELINKYSKTINNINDLNKQINSLKQNEIKRISNINQINNLLQCEFNNINNIEIICENL